MKEGMDKESMATYNIVNLESYKLFFEQSQDFPFETKTPLETVIEYYDFIIELLESIEIPIEFDFMARNKSIVLENIYPINKLNTEKAKRVIDNLREVCKAVLHVIEKRS